jgi:methyl-accepting chemotaxis protein
MQIKRKCQISAALTVAALLLGTIAADIMIDRVRVGGPIDRVAQQVDDFDAAIMPPPATLIEAHLAASLLRQYPATLPVRRRELVALERAFADSVGHWRKSDVDPALLAGLDRVARLADAYWRELNSTFIPAIGRGDLRTADASYARLSALYAEHRTALDTLVRAAVTARARLGIAASGQVKATLALLLTMAAVLMLVVGAGLLLLFRHVLAPILATAAATRQMAAGQLTVALAGGDRSDEIGEMVHALQGFRDLVMERRTAASAQEMVVQRLAGALDSLARRRMTERLGGSLPAGYEAIARSYDTAVEQLNRALTEVSETGEMVRAGAVEIRLASDHMAQRTEQQAASLGETASAMHEITTAARNTAVGAGSARQTARVMRAEAEESGQIVESAAAAMDSIRHSSAEISEIIAVIDGIAFQTNLLALNAGVEAARAGESGKGFAVVAAEVRALAQRSAEAAKDVKARITASGEEVQRGAQLVVSAAESLTRIMERVSEINQLIVEIAHSAEQEASRLQRVNAAVAEIDSVTQQNAAMAEQATAAAHGLADQADLLAGEIAQFELAEAASPAPRRHRPSRALISVE